MPANEAVAVTMTAGIPAYTVHDVARFPVVTVNHAAIKPGYAAQWIAEIDTLIERGQSFVIIQVEFSSADETHEDRKQRGAWLKAHKERLARVCKALVSVERDPAARAKADEIGAGAARAFGIPHAVASTLDDAIKIAQSIIRTND